MAKQVGKKFAWKIKNFSSLQCDEFYSAPVLIGGYKWRLHAYLNGKIEDYFSVFLEVVDFETLPSGWRRYVKVRLTIVKQVSEEHSVLKETHRWFDKESWEWGFEEMISLTKLNNEEEGFLVNGDVDVAAEVDVFEVIGTLDQSEESDEATQPLKKIRLNDDGAVSSDLLEETSSVKESIDVNGFQVLPSQVESVRLIFEKHPDIAQEFRANNPHLRKACMNFLLNLIETMCQSIQQLTNEDLVEGDIALTYLKDAGFKVAWLEKKLDQVKEKKEKERSGLARLQEIEENLLKLKEKSSELDVLAEKEKAELSATRTPLSFDDVV